MSKSSIRAFRFTEVVVPARPGSIETPGLNKPLHKIPLGGKPAWSMQFDQLPKLIIEMELADGTVGLGECYRAHDRRLVDEIAAHLLGRDLRDFPPQELPIAPCREYDGFECAVWDALAKHHGMRLVDLLGGAARNHVPVGAWTGQRTTTEEVHALAARFHAAGYDCLKFKCDLGDDVVGWARAVADAAPGMRVIFDPNERWQQPHEARSRMAALAEVGNVLCLEDPLPRWMLHEFAKLRGKWPIAVALHVSLPYIVLGNQRTDAVQALLHGAVDGFNFNGSLRGMRQLAALADLAGLPFWHGSEIDLGILEARYLHIAAASPACTWPSDIFGRLIREHDLLKRPLHIEAPVARLPDGPGLGIELDREALRHYQTNTWEITA